MVEDHRDRDSRQAAGETADPGGQNGRGRQYDIAGIPADDFVERGLDGDGQPRDEQARDDRLAGLQPQIACPRRSRPSPDPPRRPSVLGRDPSSYSSKP